MSEAIPPAASRGLYLRLTGVAALWGGTFVAGRIAAPEVPHFTLAALRFWTACLVLWPLLRWAEGRWPTLRLRDGIFTALLALFGLVAYNLLFLGALELIPAGRTALVVALNPVLTAVTLALVFGERLPAHRWLGILLALLGVWIVLAKGDPRALLQRVGPGEWMMLGGAACWAVYTLLGRFALSGGGTLSPLAMTAVTALWAAVMLSIGIPAEWAAWQPGAVSAAAWVSIAYLGAGGTALAFVWYAQGLQRLGAARTAVFNNLVPVFGVLLGTVLLAEPLLLSMLVGGAVAVAGVSLTNWNRSPPSAREPPP